MSFSFRIFLPSLINYLFFYARLRMACREHIPTGVGFRESAVGAPVTIVAERHDFLGALGNLGSTTAKLVRCGPLRRPSATCHLFICL